MHACRSLTVCYRTAYGTYCTVLVQTVRYSFSLPKLQSVAYGVRKRLTAGVLVPGTVGLEVQSVAYR
jgi:hypothetical protein